MKWLKQNWFRVGVLIVGLAGVYVLYQIFVVAPYSRQLQAQAFQARNSQDFDLQAKCTNAASTFFAGDRTGDMSPSKDSTSNISFENHFNARLGKCFILIRSDSRTDDTLGLDLWDALEGKHYAMFIGHKDCNLGDLNINGTPEKCLLDGGGLWYNGDDTATADYKVGYGNIVDGRSAGDKNTLPEFIQKVHDFMNN